MNRSLEENEKSLFILYVDIIVTYPNKDKYIYLN